MHIVSNGTKKGPPVVNRRVEKIIVEEDNKRRSDARKVHRIVSLLIANNINVVNYGLPSNSLFRDHFKNPDRLVDRAVIELMDDSNLDDVISKIESAGGKIIGTKKLEKFRILIDVANVI